MTSDGELPYFEDPNEIPEQWFEAKVDYARASVRWDGSATASGFGSTKWYGNWGEMKLSLSILSGDKEVKNVEEVHPLKYPLPYDKVAGNPISYTVAKNCGHTANMTVHQSAAVIVLIKTVVTTLTETSGSGRASSTQESCPAPPPVGGGDGGGGGDPGSGGSGQCYYYYEYYVDTGQIIPSSVRLLYCV
jgi:hypothetical protein